MRNLNSSLRRTECEGEYDGTFRFGSARHLGEDPSGDWELRVKDSQPDDTGTLNSWSITVYGHRTRPAEPKLRTLTAGDESVAVTWSAPSDIGASEITSYDLHYIPHRRNKQGRLKLGPAPRHLGRQQTPLRRWSTALPACRTMSPTTSQCGRSTIAPQVHGQIPVPQSRSTRCLLGCQATKKSTISKPGRLPSQVSRQPIQTAQRL